MQLEAKAHITVQQWIDNDGITCSAASTTTICELHRRFCELLPDQLLWVENPETGERLQLVPGKLRNRDVKVGRRNAISHGAVANFLNRFESVYSGLGKTDSILAAAAAHYQ